MPPKARQPKPLPTIHKFGSDEEAGAAFRDVLPRLADRFEADPLAGMHEAAKVMVALAWGLSDLRRERAVFVRLAELTRPPSPRGNPLPLGRTKAAVIAAADVLKRLVNDKETACTDVARVVDKLGLRLGKKDVEKKTWEVIAGMRSDYLRRKGDDAVISYFDYWRGIHAEKLSALEEPLEIKKKAVLRWLENYLTTNRADWAEGFKE